jgi:hypothetical protein
MGEVADLEQLLRRLLAGSASEADRGALEEAFASGRLTLATGARAGDIIIVTGDGNILFQGGDAAAVREAFLALYPARLRQLPADLPDFTGREAAVEKTASIGPGRFGPGGHLGPGGHGRHWQDRLSGTRGP